VQHASFSIPIGSDFHQLNYEGKKGEKIQMKEGEKQPQTARRNRHVNPKGKEREKERGERGDLMKFEGDRDLKEKS
jgi:hypothetical protein